MTSMNKVFADLPVTVFEAMSQAARDNNACAQCGDRLAPPLRR